MTLEQQEPETPKKFDFEKWRSEGLIAIEDLRDERDRLSARLSTVEENLRSMEETLAIRPKVARPASASASKGRKFRIRPLILQVLFENPGEVKLETIVDAIQESNSSITVSAIEAACRRLASANKTVKETKVETSPGNETFTYRWDAPSNDSASDA